MSNLLAQLKAAPATSFTPASELSEDERAFIEVLPPEVWEQISWFFDEIDCLKLYSSDDEHTTRRNGWSIAGEMLESTVMDEMIGEPTGEPMDYLENYRLIGVSSMGGDRIAIGCAPECLGKIAFVHLGLQSEGGNIPIVAESFREFLEKTLNAGIDAEWPYWMLRGFKDLGPAIPSDEYYEPPQPVE